MDMIWTHELSHGVHGHIDFAKANLGLRALNEQPRGEGDLRLMPMEAEADRFAVISVVQTAMVGDAAPYLPLQLKSLSPEIRVTSALVVAALLTWFWAFQQRIDRTYDGLDPYTTGSHPPPLVRLHLAFDMARQFLSQQGWPTPMIEKTVFEAMINLEALALAKSWFSILDPARSFGEQANGFVRDVKRTMGDAFREIDASWHRIVSRCRSRPNERPVSRYILRWRIHYLMEYNSALPLIKYKEPTLLVASSFPSS